MPLFPVSHSSIEPWCITNTHGEHKNTASRVILVLLWAVRRLISSGSHSVSLALTVHIIISLNTYSGPNQGRTTRCVYISVNPDAVLKSLPVGSLGFGTTLLYLVRFGIFALTSLRSASSAWPESLVTSEVRFRMKSSFHSL